LLKPLDHDIINEHLLISNPLSYHFIGKISSFLDVSFKNIELGLMEKVVKEKNWPN